MPDYVILMSWTDQGVRADRDTVRRRDQANALAEKYGARIEHVYWTMGHHDIVAVIGAPDDESITIVAGLNSTSVKVLIEGLQVIGTRRPPAAPPAEGAPAPSGEPGTALTGEQEIVIVSGTAQQIELIRFAQVASPDGASIAFALRSPKDFIDANGQPVVPPPAGTSGVVLKTLVDGGYGVLRPELVEAILPTQSRP